MIFNDFHSFSIAADLSGPRLRAAAAPCGARGGRRRHRGAVRGAGGERGAAGARPRPGLRGAA